MTHTESTPTADSLDVLRSAWAIAVAKFGPNSVQAYDLESAIASAEADERVAFVEPESGLDEGVCPICDEVHELSFDDITEHDAARDRARARREDVDAIYARTTSTTPPCEHGDPWCEDCAERAIAALDGMAADDPRAVADETLIAQARLHAEASGTSLPDDIGVTLRALIEMAGQDDLVDMSKAATSATAAVLAIRAAVQYRAKAARLAWLAVQHDGKRGERWAAARERHTLLVDVLAEIDAVIGDRLH
jgi:hypothetical protein